MRIEVVRLADGKHVGSVGSWEAAEAVARLLGANYKVAANLIWTGMALLPQPTKNVLLIDLD